MKEVREIDRGFKQEEYYGWRAAEHTATDYVKHCNNAIYDDSIFENFKSISLEISNCSTASISLDADEWIDKRKDINIEIKTI